MGPDPSDSNLISRLSANVPRYTSYPTAPHFSADVQSETYRDWLGQVPADTSISLYVHVPFCDRLCWFCACATKQTRKYAPVKRYLDTLHLEIKTVAEELGHRGNVTALHLGGGSPTMLHPEDMIELSNRLKENFCFLPGAEISVEIDPNDMNSERYRALAEIGMTRASLGVQDFDENVQKAINRQQSFDQTRMVVEAVRSSGATSVNIDLLYGLPHQSIKSIEKTLDQVLILAPDRIALFGYAHVPWMKKHQTMIDESVLPGPLERFEQAGHAALRLTRSGYSRIGIDHFAKPDDGLTLAARQGAVRRNFQGYTTDMAGAIIGLGASAIGRLPQGYVQNMPATGGYERMISDNGLATVRGFELGDDDRVRAQIIERLMCDFCFSASALIGEFGPSAQPAIAQARLVCAREPDLLIEKYNGEFYVPAENRNFVRITASQFDSHLGHGAARHSSAV